MNLLDTLADAENMIANLREAHENGVCVDDIVAALEDVVRRYFDDAANRAG